MTCRLSAFSGGMPTTAAILAMTLCTVRVVSCGSQASELVRPADCRPPVPFSVVTPARRSLGSAVSMMCAISSSVKMPSKVATVGSVSSACVR